MVKISLAPVAGAVACAAIFSEATRVGVIFQMATDAFIRCISVRASRCMATFAGSRAMHAAQGKICQRMVERRFIDDNDFGIATFVVSVAVRAFKLLRNRQASVKPAGALDIAANFRVALDTEFCLLAV